MSCAFDPIFHAATGHLPYDYQRRQRAVFVLADSPSLADANANPRPKP
jgi:hypothetical protein